MPDSTEARTIRVKIPEAFIGMPTVYLKKSAIADVAFRDSFEKCSRVREIFVRFSVGGDR